jgi:hypothetical protein
MHQTINQAPNTQIDKNAARLLPNRVVFIRDPLERFNSFFNHLYAMELNSTGYSAGFLPKDQVFAFGERLRGSIGTNDWKFDPQRYAMKIAADRGGREDTTLATYLDNKDYEALVDYVLSRQSTDDHWGSQTDLCSDDSGFIPNLVFKFEDVNSTWSTYFSSPLIHSNSWPTISHDPYRLAELESFYADDIALRGTL